MIGNCRGCFEELCMAFEYAGEGLNMATMKGDPSENLRGKGHFFVIMVDDNGKVRVS